MTTEKKQKNIEAIYPLSPMQQGMLFHTLYAPDKGVYIEQYHCSLEGHLNQSLFEQAWHKVVERYAVLRTLFVWENQKQPLQVVLKTVKFSLNTQDWREMPESQQQESLKTFLESDRSEQFALNQAPLMRCSLIQVADKHYELIWSFHHILLDAWSVPIIFHDVFAFYEAFCQGESLSLGPTPPYRNYINWLQKQDLAAAEKFWQKTLQGFTNPISLVSKTAVNQLAKQPESYEEKSFLLSESLTTRMESLVREHRLTLSTLFQAGWGLALSYYSGESDLVFGSSFSGRSPTLKGVEKMVGIFINTLPVRIKIEPKLSLIDWLKDFQGKQIEVEQYSYSSLSDIQKWSELPANKPLFESMFTFANLPFDSSLSNGKSGIAIKNWQVANQTHYPLTVIVIPGSKVSVRIIYDNYQTATDIINFLANTYQQVLENICEHPTAKANELIKQIELNSKTVSPEKKKKQQKLDMHVHHLGIACKDITEGIQQAEKSYNVTKVSKIIFDEFQNANVCLIETDNGINLELVSGSPVENLLNQGITLYHVCYETPDLQAAIQEYLSEGGTLVAEPKPAKLFDHRLVAFVNTPFGLVEFLEETKSPLAEKILEEWGISKTDHQQQKIAIAATFTAESVKESLAFWWQELDLPWQIQFAPYNQIFQQLLDPASHLSQNNKGVNVILVRFEDWLKLEEGLPEIANRAEELTECLEGSAQDLILALQSATQRNTSPYLVCFCPPSPSFLENNQGATFLQQIEIELAARLKTISGVYVCTNDELKFLYQVADYDDPQRNALGHIPYTPLFFTALGTMIARKLWAIARKAYKVIILDCDQTLWQGICGEVGAKGINIGTPWQKLQEFMVAQKEAGMLLCLCSKNNEEDVFAVFEEHPEMPLKLAHLVSRRLNWQSKSKNLKSLAEELKLGLDSFIFIDDNPVEIAEVRANCPEVLAIQLPQDSNQIPLFLEHFWALDVLKVTAEDRARTEMYRQNIERESFQQESLTFDEFIAGLKLVIDIDWLTDSQLARAAQLTQRTNQFNATTIRRYEAELRELCQSKQLEALTVKVGDRFGDYGLVGLMLFSEDLELIKTDTFLLSCRVLGRGVEHKMLAKLAVLAQERGLKWVEVNYQTTEKNQPVWDFLNQVGETYKQKTAQGWLFRFPTEAIAQLTFKKGEDQSTAKEPSKPSQKIDFVPPSQNLGLLYERIATELSSIDLIFKEVEAWQQKERPSLAQEFVAPRNSTEELLANIWQEVLHVERVGVYDNFFELGGNSLLATQVFSRLRQVFEVELPLRSVFESSTIANLAELLIAQQLAQVESESLEKIIAEVEELSEEGTKEQLLVEEK